MNRYQKILSIVLATAIFIGTLTFQSSNAQSQTPHTEIDSTPSSSRNYNN